MTRPVYIVRHGNTFDKGDTVTRVGARTDLPLSNSGYAQAEALAKHFTAEQVEFQRILTSPLKRTHQTAEAIANAQPAKIALEPCDFLREIDYGPDENQPEADVVARIGEQALADWEREAIVPEGWQVDPQALKQAWSNCFEGLRAIEPDTGPALIVTSNGIARFALQVALGGQESDLPLKLATGAIGRIDVSRDGDLDVAFWNQRPVPA